MVLIGSACSKARPLPLPGPTTTAGPQITVTQASVNSSRQVVVSYTITQGGQGLTGAAASSLAPAWTLAGLSTDPETRNLPPDPATNNVRPPVPAWQSYLLTGSETLASLPIDGPGSNVVLSNVTQPGSESGGTVQDLGRGNFSYTFQNALPQGFDSSQTLRVGVWLQGTPGTPQTTSTFDFVPNGGAVQARELVLDNNCNKCHGTIQGHGGSRTGTKICLTCHTYQNADADTVDPAALTGATASTNPNPLDLGRLVHRIHRGRNLPTLYAANPPVAGTEAHPNIALPFNPSRNTPVLGQKYSIVGFQSGETVFGRTVSRIDNGQPAKPFATGVGFPQDLRNCDACHGGAAQTAEHSNDISRRTCQGCHADAWFQDTSVAPITDQVHFAHAGGPQPDDSACYGCHVPTPAAPVVDADITDLHVAPVNSPHYNGLTAKIVSVQGLTPGQKPTVVFTLADKSGTVSPLNDPTVRTDLPYPDTYPLPRALGRLAITISGPTSPDYHTGNFAGTTTAPITESVPLSTTANASGQFSYPFKSTIPANATGTWAVAIEARRSYDSLFYDAPSDTFFWPFTGETIEETADNPVQYVDVSVGSAPGGKPIARRQVVNRDNCNNCHMALTAHGDLRHTVDYCLMCHAPDATDWSQRPQINGNTNLNGTSDNIEERSIHFKVLVHRIHTGGRTGSAELDLARPFAVYGFGGSVNLFDGVRFPNNLANCTLCHQGTSYAVESVPADAQPTVANETATIQHQGTAAHGSGEAQIPAVQAACTACHDTGAAQLHAQQNTQCAVCHGLGHFMSVKTVHGVSP
jgi:OmcA/MtrC family decaheme c-type cytochrome